MYNNIIEEYEVNTEGRDFVIGDLHGCYSQFKHTLKEISFDKKKDRIFSVGDLIDRGSNNKQCIELLTKPWFHSVMGNHEQMMIEAQHNVSMFHSWCINGGGWNSSENISEKDWKNYISLAKNMPLVIKVKTKTGKTIGISHAQPPRDCNWNDKDNISKGLNTLLWARSLISQPEENIPYHIGVDRSYHGHTPLTNNTSLVKGNCHWIDLGCVYGGKLHIERIDDV